MVGIRLIIIMAIVGGLIAYIADKMGSKIGKKKLTVFGLRPKYTSMLLTVIGGVLISTLTIITVTISSESARTALFGMEKIQSELKALNKEKEAATVALKDAQNNVAEQNKKISELDKEIKTSSEAKAKMEADLAAVNDKYNAAQSEVKNLSEAKNVLTKDIKDLEAVTERLRADVVNLRDGQVFYRAGELVYVAVLRAGMTPEQNKDQLNWLLNNTNQIAMQRLGQVVSDKKLQVVWISPEILNEAAEILKKAKTDYLCRVRTIANIMVGELVVCDIEMVPNKLIYANGTTVYSCDYDTEALKVPPEALIMDFLSNVNHTAVAAGVLADPLTGKVGNIDAETMVYASNDVKNCKNGFTLIAYTKSDVTTAGPVHVGLRVKPRKATGVE